MLGKLPPPMRWFMCHERRSDGFIYAALVIPSSSWEDARRWLNAYRSNAWVEGEIEDIIPVKK